MAKKLKLSEARSLNYEIAPKSTLEVDCWVAAYFTSEHSMWTLLLGRFSNSFEAQKFWSCSDRDADLKSQGEEKIFIDVDDTTEVSTTSSHEEPDGVQIGHIYDNDDDDFVYNLPTPWTPRKAFSSGYYHQIQ